MSSLDYLKEMGITLWQRRGSTSPEANPSSPDWDSLKQQVSACTLCDLHKTRKNPVFGVGSTQAKIMIIGEAPGAEEDRQGEPFVGRAGQLLNAMLASIGITRESVFITNILKCRPPGNPNPEPTEVDCCTPYLNQQVALLKPTLILALGQFSAHFLLNSTASLSSLRGKQHHYGADKTPVIVSYHPAYLLRSPTDKQKSYQDLCQVKTLLSAL
jgi:uracil-DNA glycosylase family 4